MTVEVEPDVEPIAGSLDDGRGAPIEFAGWLELMSAFETARARAATGAPRDSRDAASEEHRA